MSKSNNKCDKVIKQALYNWACKLPVHQAIKNSMCGEPHLEGGAIIGIEPKAVPVTKKKTTIIVMDDKKKKEDKKKDNDKDDDKS